MSTTSQHVHKCSSCGTWDAVPMDHDELIRKATIVRPGDTLVIAFDKSISVAQHQEFVQQMDRNLPEGVRALVLGGAVELYVLRTGETERPAPDAGDES